MPFIDISYQGLGSGSIEKDAFCIRHLAELGVEMIIAHSYSKIMGLYGERVGSLTITSQNKSIFENLIAQMEIIIRSNYSNPPRHGSSIAAYILNNQYLKSSWLNELKQMDDRIRLMRTCLVSNLKKEKSNQDWNFILEHEGMFSYTGFNEHQVEINSCLCFKIA